MNLKKSGEGYMECLKEGEGRGNIIIILMNSKIKTIFKIY